MEKNKTFFFCFIVKSGGKQQNAFHLFSSFNKMVNKVDCLFLSVYMNLFSLQVKIICLVFFFVNTFILPPLLPSFGRKGGLEKNISYLLFWHSRHYTHHSPPPSQLLWQEEEETHRQVNLKPPYYTYMWLWVRFVCDRCGRCEQRLVNDEMKARERVKSLCWWWVWIQRRQTLSHHFNMLVKTDNSWRVQMLLKEPRKRRSWRLREMMLPSAARMSKQTYTFHHL